MEAADKKRDELIEVIRFMAESSGWKVTIADMNLNSPALD